MPASLDDIIAAEVFAGRNKDREGPPASSSSYRTDATATARRQCQADRVSHPAWRLDADYRWLLSAPVVVERARLSRSAEQVP